jgi:branched-chain amino acid transport system substrate-binding protein
MFSIKNIRISSYILIFSLVCMLLISGCVQSQNDIVEVGVVTSLSGNGATLGKPFTEGMVLATEEINAAGGINGKQLVLHIEDGKMEGQATNSATKFIIDLYHPKAMVTLYHVEAEAMSPLTNLEEIPLLHMSFARSIAEKDPFAFKINFDALDGCKQLVQYSKDNKKYKKLGALMSRVAYNEYCLQGAQEIEEDISEYWYEFGNTDFRTLLLKAKEDGVDALLTVGIDFEYIEMFKQMAELDYNINLFCATASECINPGLEQQDYPSFDGTVSVDFVHPRNMEESDFADKYYSRYPDSRGAVITQAGAGYDTIMILQSVFEKCDSEDKECIQSALESYKNQDGDSVIGTIGFEDRVLKLDYQIYEFNKNGWEQK